MFSSISKYVDYLIRVILSTGMIISSMGCSDDKENIEENLTNPLQLHFNICTTSSTRATGEESENETEGSGAENFLNVNDLVYLLFDSEGKFLCDLSPEARTVASGSNFTVYDVVASVNNPYFSNPADEIVDFYILMLANFSGWGVEIPELKEGDSFDLLFQNGLIMDRLPETSLLRKASDNNASDRQLFPMAGMQRFAVASSMMKLAQGVPFDLTNATGKSLDLLRAFAKLEIVDRINIPAESVYDPETDGLSPLRISAAELNGIMTKGRLLPEKTRWTSQLGYPVTSQVESPSIPVFTDPESIYRLPPVLDENLNFGENGELTIPYSITLAPDPEATKLRTDRCPVFSCYIFEYQRQAITSAGVPLTQLPYFRIKIKGGATRIEDDPTVIESTVYPVRIANYNSGTPSLSDNLPSLLRNHIYRFEVGGLGADIKINWTLCPMDQANGEIIFN